MQYFVKLNIGGDIMLKFGFWITIVDLIFSILYYFFGHYVLALLPDIETWINAKIIISSLIAAVAVCAIIISILAIRKEKENINKGMIIASVLISFVIFVYHAGLALEINEMKPEYIAEFRDYIQNEQTAEEKEVGLIYGTGEYKNLYYNEEDIYYIKECYNELEEIIDNLIKKIQNKESKSVENIIGEILYDEISIYVDEDMASIIKDKYVKEKLIFESSNINFYEIDFEKLEQLISKYNIKTDLFINEDKFNNMYYAILIDVNGNLYINPDETIFDETKFYTRFDEERGLAYIQCIKEVETILDSLTEEKRKEVIEYCKVDTVYTKDDIINFMEEQDKIDMITNQDVKNILYKEYNDGVVLFDLYKFLEYSTSHQNVFDFSYDKLTKIPSHMVLLDENSIYILPRNVVFSYYSWWE